MHSYRAAEVNDWREFLASRPGGTPSSIASQSGGVPVNRSRPACRNGRRRWTSCT
jgi:hypothetical protein